MDTKFGTNVSNRMLLNAAKCQGYSFYSVGGAGAGQNYPPHTHTHTQIRVKIIFKSPKLIAQESLSYEHLLKDKRLKFTFLREPTCQVLVCGSSLSKKTLIDENRYFFLILDLGPPRNQKFGLFSMGKNLYKKILKCES